MTIATHANIFMGSSPRPIDMNHKDGFTLVELSIVLVVIGLLLGGILGGRELIAAAQIRAQLTQIDGYRVAALAFKEKYFYLPGDLPEPTASAAGLTARGTGAGRGDGNGLLEGLNTAGQASPARFRGGETAVFWSDLSKKELISGSFTMATTAPPDSSVVIDDDSLGLHVSQYHPRGKLSGTYVSAGGIPSFTATSAPSSAAQLTNYFFLSRIKQSNQSGLTIQDGLAPWGVDGPIGVTVTQAFGMDSKVDDGNPLTGKVLALYTEDAKAYWASAAGYSDFGYTYFPKSASDKTCFDNKNTDTPPVYSTAFNDGNSAACGLAFQMF